MKLKVKKSGKLGVVKKILHYLKKIPEYIRKFERMI